MPRALHTQSPSRPALLWYNAAVNVFWSVLCLTPLGIFCYRSLPRPWLYPFLAISLLVYVLPTSLFSRLQLSAHPAAYRRLGIHRINSLVQNGRVISDRINPNEHLRLRAPSHRAALLHATHRQERFHWAMFLFFLLASGYAATQRQLFWSLLLLLANFIYNVCPILLQQHTRLRLDRFALHTE